MLLVCGCNETKDAPLDSIGSGAACPLGQENSGIVNSEMESITVSEVPCSEEEDRRHQAEQQAVAAKNLVDASEVRRNQFIDIDEGADIEAKAAPVEPVGPPPPSANADHPDQVFSI